MIVRKPHFFLHFSSSVLYHVSFCWWNLSGFFSLNNWLFSLFLGKIGASILDVILESSYLITDRDEIPDWINSIGVLISNLPESYWDGLYSRLISALTTTPLVQWTIPQDAFKVFNFSEKKECKGHTRYVHIKMLEYFPPLFDLTIVGIFEYFNLEGTRTVIY